MVPGHTQLQTLCWQAGPPFWGPIQGSQEELLCRSQWFLAAHSCKHCVGRLDPLFGVPYRAVKKNSRPERAIRMQSGRHTRPGEQQTQSKKQSRKQSCHQDSMATCQNSPEATYSGVMCENCYRTDTFGLQSPRLHDDLQNSPNLGPEAPHRRVLIGKRL